MVRQRRRKRDHRRRSEAAELAGRAHEQGLARTVDDALRYQECKQKHQTYSKEIYEREQELLSRTLYVSNATNLQFGEIWSFCDCSSSKPTGLWSFVGWPRILARQLGLVDFRRRESDSSTARSLPTSRATRTRVEVFRTAPLVSREYFEIQPSARYPGMDLLAVDSTNSFSGHRVLIGH